MYTDLTIFSTRRYASGGASHGLLYVSVCLSVTSRCSVKRDERINLVLAWGFFRPVLLCVLKKFSYLQNKGTSLWNFFLN